MGVIVDWDHLLKCQNVYFKKLGQRKMDTQDPVRSAAKKAFEGSDGSNLTTQDTSTKE